MTRQLLFVYGTLRQGESANHLLGDAQFVRPAVTAPHYRLLHVGDHSGLVVSYGPGLAIKGELWLVDVESFPELDAYEGAPTVYGRRPILMQDCVESVIAYFFLGDRTGLSEFGAECPRERPD
jgi:gamma-glutamylcyclotransferase (GGCT)/AIG2-like uncharacterized protein YtfP